MPPFSLPTRRGRAKQAPAIGLLAAALLIAGSTAAAAPDAAPVTGTVRDAQSKPIAGADVVLASADRTRVLSTRSDPQGRFRFDAVRPGAYVLSAAAPMLRDWRGTLLVGNTPPAEIVITLDVAGPIEEVTVTATRNAALDTRSAGQPVNVVSRSEIEARVRTVVAQAVDGEAGVALQQTSPTMAGVFVRGLTGNKVNVFVDGVRYSNGAQRGGVNTFLDLIDPASLDAIEILRGPSSAQYGSDALGGSIQFVTQPPSLFAGGRHVRATVGAAAGTAHRYAGLDVSVGYAGAGVGLAGTFAGRTVGSIRPGGGVDSHSAITRYLGQPSTTYLDERLPDTGFEQVGGSARLNWAPTPSTHVVAAYFRTGQDGGRRFDQLLGGDGNLIADLNDLSLDLFYTRLERAEVGPFDTLSVTYSLNSQREERVNQGGNGNPNASISHEPERTTVHGVQTLMSRQFSPRAFLGVGGDIYFERLTSDAFNVNPAIGTQTVRRPRVPDEATFRQGGVYAQASYDVRPDGLRLFGAARVAGASYRARAADAPVVNGEPLWPDDSLTVGGATFRAGTVFVPRPAWTITASVSRGFRAPHMTDLGTLGLTGSGFEVAAPDVAGLDAAVGTTADASAVSSGEAVVQLTPESSVSYEGSLRYRDKVVDAEVTVFVNDVHDNIQKLSLILPPGAVGVSLGGTPITAQNSNGVVFVAASPNPVLVRANVDDARIWGIEHSARVKLGPRVLVQSAFTYLHARDTRTDLPPNIEGGTPAPELWLSAQYAAADGRWWVQPYTRFGWEQGRLSSLDLGDRRIGAGRSRSNIQSFFRNGATARGWVAAGPDRAFGTTDDVLMSTGETLAQVQARVLGVGVSSAPMFTAIPGYQVLGIRAGLRLGAHELMVVLENLTDENYRGVSWGVDAPGRGVTVKFHARF